MQLSFWEKQSFFSNIDVTIIGSGIVGLSAAICLKEKNPSIKVLVVERGFLPYGASTRNAGFACFGSVSELLDDLSKESEQEVFARVEKRWKGLLRLRNLLGDDKISFENKGGYEVFTPAEKELFEQCATKISYLNNHLKSITGVNETFSLTNDKIKEFGFSKVDNLILNKSEGQIDTGKMMMALLNHARENGVLIINGMAIENITSSDNGVELVTDKEFLFQTKKLLICNNGFARHLLPELNVEPARAQVLITSPIENLKVRGTFHYQQGYYYFRDVGERVLFGGGRNLNFEAETTTSFGLSEQIQQSLDKILQEVILPNTKYSIEQRWSGIMGIGKSKSPIIKKIKPGVYCAIRMGGMGIAIGSLVGQESASLVFEV